MKNATAYLKNLHMTPRKVRLVIDVVRGMPVMEAEAQLAMMRKRAAPAILKLLRSAIANAKDQKLAEARLTVSVIRVDQGPTMKRFLPRAKGSASPIHKMSSHVSITLAESAKELKPVRFAMIRPEKKAERTKSAAPRKTAKPKGKADSTVGKKSAEEPGFMRRVFRRKIG